MLSSATETQVATEGAMSMMDDSLDKRLERMFRGSTSGSATEFNPHGTFLKKPFASPPKAAKPGVPPLPMTPSKPATSPGEKPLKTPDIKEVEKKIEDMLWEPGFLSPSLPTLPEISSDYVSEAPKRLFNEPEANDTVQKKQKIASESPTAVAPTPMVVKLRLPPRPQTSGKTTSTEPVAPKVKAEEKKDPVKPKEKMETNSNSAEKDNKEKDATPGPKILKVKAEEVTKEEKAPSTPAADSLPKQSEGDKPAKAKPRSGDGQEEGGAAVAAVAATTKPVIIKKASPEELKKKAQEQEGEKKEKEGDKEKEKEKEKEKPKDKERDASEPDTKPKKVKEEGDHQAQKDKGGEKDPKARDKSPTKPKPSQQRDRSRSRSRSRDRQRNRSLDRSSKTHRSRSRSPDSRHKPRGRSSERPSGKDRDRDRDRDRSRERSKLDTRIEDKSKDKARDKEKGNDRTEKSGDKKKKESEVSSPEKSESPESTKKGDSPSSPDSLRGLTSLQIRSKAVDCKRLGDAARERDRNGDDAQILYMKSGVLFTMAIFQGEAENWGDSRKPNFAFMKESTDFVRKHSESTRASKDLKLRERLRFFASVGFRCVSLLEQRYLYLKREAMKKNTKEVRQMLAVIQGTTNGEAKEETSTPSPLQPNAVASPLPPGGTGLKPDDFPSKKVLELLADTELMYSSLEQWQLAEDLWKGNEYAKGLKLPKAPFQASPVSEILDYLDFCYALFPASSSLTH